MVGVEALELLLSGRDPVSGTPLGRELQDRVTNDGRRVRAAAVGEVVSEIGTRWSVKVPTPEAMRTAPQARWSCTEHRHRTRRNAASGECRMACRSS